MTKKDIDSILSFTNSYDRFETFLRIAPALSGKMYWYALGSAYCNTDNLYNYGRQVKAAFASNEPFREYLMNRKDRRAWKELPDELTIYRGMSTDEFNSELSGVSWTLNEEVAQFFAYEYGRNQSTNELKREIAVKIVDKSEVIAYFNGRKEHEVIVLQNVPENLESKMIGLIPNLTNDPSNNQEIRDVINKYIFGY